MTDNNFILGIITKVRWHTRLYKISNYNYGHMSETYDEDNINANPYRTINTNMNPDKNYAMVTLDKYGNIFVRTFFDSKDPEGFEQKNSYFEDDIADKFMMSDENNVLLNYIKLGYPEVTTIKNVDNHGWLYFCVEYKINDGLNPNLLNYCISLEYKYSQIEHRLTYIEQKIKNDNKESNNKESNNKSWYFKFQLF